MLNFDQFRLLTFDCYGTLIDWEAGIFSALRPILAHHGKTISDSDLLRLYSELESEAELGEFRPYRQVLESVVHGFGERLGFTPTESQARSLPDSLPNWLPFPDTIAALGKLKARYRLAIISNVDDDLFAASARRFEVTFDYVITAQQARAYKPSLQIFRLAQQRTGVA
ncbi:MAG: HAD-IA family hydrolase, partial [Terriglobales bacterium]